MMESFIPTIVLERTYTTYYLVVKIYYYEDLFLYMYKKIMYTGLIINLSKFCFWEVPSNIIILNAIWTRFFFTFLGGFLLANIDDFLKVEAVLWGTFEKSSKITQKY